MKNTKQNKLDLSERMEELVFCPLDPLLGPPTNLPTEPPPLYSFLMDCVIRHQRIPIAIGHTGIRPVRYFLVLSWSLSLSLFFVRFLFVSIVVVVDPPL